MKKVYGKYINATEARVAVKELLRQGYRQDQIKVISNTDLGQDLSYRREDVDVDDRSLWEKIKDAFTFDEYDDDYLDRDLDADETRLLEPYRTNLQNGETVILVEENVDLNKDGIDPLNRREFKDDVDEERVIELKKEKLNIDKDMVETGEVNVKKVIKEETQTVEVPLEKEEIVIERRPSHNKGEVEEGIVDDEIWGDKDEIHIPIREERVDVDKKTVVDDEVVVKKVKHKENELVSEKVRHEEVEVDGEADVRGNLDGDKDPVDLSKEERDALDREIDRKNTKTDINKPL